mmetsp:Transcript_9021/g.25921  ORF Transcript_9021/g.25921 Transcript_9021/m.25921 type:complete len:708 (-) Transcript_9021:51-2174(-)
MKFAVSAALVALAAAPAQGAQFLGVAGGKVKNPMERVVGLIEQLKDRIILDGKAEQASYDQYACWCEDSLGRKAKDISTAKEQIDELGALIVKLKAEIASHGSEIVQTKKDLAANVESRREATEIRDKEHATFQAEKTEGEQCTGALEAAVRVLAGAGSKRGFLETMQEAQLLSVVAGVKTVFRRPAVSKSMSSEDLDMVKRFVERPEDFVGGRSGVSAAQVSNNPFGDYAPQSTQIQGILKGMYDTFVGDLEKSNAEEAEAQKSHEDLMRTKMAEAETLQATLEQHTLDEATKSKQLSDSQQILDVTKEQLSADEALFADMKEGCANKATEWSERTRLRTEELAGIDKAIAILSSDEAKEIFERSATTFMQLSAARRLDGDHRTAVVSKLTQLAAKYKSSNTAEVAHMLKSGGHFDKVMAAIDGMIAVLRQEEQEDIAHRDRCQNANDKSKNDVEDLHSDIEKAEQSLKHLESEMKRLEAEVIAIEDEITVTKTQRDERLRMRNQEEEEFKQALKDDSDAVALLEEATQTMKEFYARNKKSMSLAAHKQEPEYTVDPDKAPETTWKGSDYGGKKTETRGIVAILEMITEDLRNEMKVARKDDAAAQKQFEEEDRAIKQTLDTQLELKMKKERELNDVESKLQDKHESKAAKEGDLAAETSLADSIYSDCAWVESHFEQRRVERKAELNGLAEAKAYLAGVESGDQI